MSRPLKIISPYPCAVCGQQGQRNGLWWFNRTVRGDVRCLCVRCVAAGWRFTEAGEPEQITQQLGGRRMVAEKH